MVSHKSTYKRSDLPWCRKRQIANVNLSRYYLSTSFVCDLFRFRFNTSREEIFHVQGKNFYLNVKRNQTIDQRV